MGCGGKYELPRSPKALDFSLSAVGKRGLDGVQCNMLRMVAGCFWKSVWQAETLLLRERRWPPSGRRSRFMALTGDAASK